MRLLQIVLILLLTSCKQRQPGAEVRSSSEASIDDLLARGRVLVESVAADLVVDLPPDGGSDRMALTESTPADDIAKLSRDVDQVILSLIELSEAQARGKPLDLKHVNELKDNLAALKLQIKEATESQRESTAELNRRAQKVAAAAKNKNAVAEQAKVPAIPPAQLGADLEQGEIDQIVARRKLKQVIITDAPPASKEAWFKIYLPSRDCEVFVDGGATESSGLVRKFNSTELESHAYIYTFKVTWTENGEQRQRSLDLVIQRGKIYDIDLTR